MSKTITLCAPRSSAAQQLRSAASKISARVFSERVATVVSSAGAAASFVLAVAEQPRTCALVIAATLPWFISLFSKKGGAK